MKKSRRLHSRVYGSITKLPDKSYDITIPQAIQMPSSYNPFIPLQHIQRIDAVVVNNEQLPVRAGFTEFGSRLKTQKQEPVKPLGLTLGDFHMQFPQNDKGVETILKQIKLTPEQFNVLNKVEKLNFRSIPMEEKRVFCNNNRIQFDIYQGDNAIFRVPCSQPDEIVPKLLQLFQITSNTNPFNNQSFYTPNMQLMMGTPVMGGTPQPPTYNILASKLQEAKRSSTSSSTSPSSSTPSSTAVVPSTPLPTYPGYAPVSIHREAFGGERVEDGWVFPIEIQQWITELPIEQVPVFNLRDSPSLWMGHVSEWYAYYRNYTEIAYQLNQSNNILEQMKHLMKFVDNTATLYIETHNLHIMYTSALGVDPTPIATNVFGNTNWFSDVNRKKEEDKFPYIIGFQSFLQQTLNQFDTQIRVWKQEIRTQLVKHWATQCRESNCRWLPDGVSQNVPLIDALRFYAMDICNVFSNYRDATTSSQARVPECPVTAKSIRDILVLFFDKTYPQTPSVCDLVMDIFPLLDSYASLTTTLRTIPWAETLTQLENPYNIPQQQRTPERGFSLLLALLMSICHAEMVTAIRS